ncbi:MAG: hypothetical protein JO270_20650 [Acidobacteriaceae bacterium]|nr:hypothetical protein [Acidobacteriaceae bacterium]
MKRGMLCAALAVLLGSTAWGQAFDPNTPDGAMVSQIQSTTDPAEKQTRLEGFVQKFPTSKQAGWAWGQLQASYLQAQQYDKAIAAGEKSLAADPDETEVAYNNLKAAEAKNDPGAVAKWATATSQIAKKESAGADKARADYAKQVETYTEYSVYATTLKTTDSTKIVELVESLEARAPQSPYLSKAYGRYLNALRQSGQAAKAGTAAEQELLRDPSNEDVLLFAADYSRDKKDTAKTIAYSQKLVEVMQTKPKPEEVSDADWQKKKQTMIGVAYWMEGVSYNDEKQYAPADKSLREALPLVKSDEQLLPIVLFQLGVADFELGKTTKNRAMLKDALNYSQQSAALKSPVQADAANNVKAISHSLAPAAHK